MRCTAITVKGKLCKASAVHGTDPPLCSAHAGRNKGAGAPPGNNNRADHGFYSSAFHGQEIADIIRYSDDMSLDDEIALVRVTLRRLLKRMTGADTQMDIDDLAKIAPLAFTGSNTVARLLRARRAISGEAADGIAGAIAQALDEIGTDLGLEL